MCLNLANGYIEPKDEKKAVSLLKPYTNFDNLKAMDAKAFAEKLAIVEVNAVGVYISMDGTEYNRLKSERKKQWLEWLESEAEECH